SGTASIRTVDQVKTLPELLHQLAQGEIQLHRDRPQWQQSLSMLDHQLVRLLQKIHQLHHSSDPSVLVQLDTELQSVRQQLDSIALQQNQLTLEKLKTDCDKLKRSIRTEIEKLNTQGKGNHAHGLEQLEQEVGLITKRIEQLDVKTK